jgi:hypothetical protein
MDRLDIFQAKRRDFLGAETRKHVTLKQAPNSARVDRRRMKMERETGFEPATNSLEGCDSTPELLPHQTLRRPRSEEGMVEAGGFEPP